jgi:hypothetical protein
MTQSIRIIAVVALACALWTPAARAADLPNERERPLILVHYMPWYEAKPASAHWGWHWTMNHFDPERSDATGRREIASHYYPMIGPYDSADPGVLEYHALLMKVAGVDGVIADWYGNDNFNDYAMIHRRTEALFETLRSRGLKFAVCYEDRILKAMAEQRKLTPEQAVEHGREHLRFLDEDWFARPGYLTWQGKPLLLVFGPAYLNTPQWEGLMSGLRHPPAFFTLHERRAPAVGSFAWPPMWAAKDGVLDEEELDGYFDDFFARDGAKIAAAFPGFHDIYQQAGTQPSYGRLDAADGETFRRTLDRALASGSPLVQIATWNDFGEGTCVEPAREYGYRYLEAIQHARRRLEGEPFTFEAAALRLPRRVFELRKRLGKSSPERAALDAVVDRLFAADVARATRDLDALEQHAPPPHTDR